MRFFGQEVYDGLKARVRALIRSNGGFAYAPDNTRVERATLHVYCDLKHVGQMPIDVVADLEGAIDEPVVTRALAALRGFKLVPMEPDEPKSEKIEPLKACAEATERVGKLSATTLAAVEDGKIDNHELDTLIAHHDDSARFHHQEADTYRREKARRAAEAERQRAA